MMVRTVLACLLAAVVTAGAGCESTTSKDRKRAEDRAAIELSQARRERDEFKARAEQLQTSASDFEAKQILSRQQADALRAELLQARAELAQARGELQKAQEAAGQSKDTTAQLQKRANDLSAQLVAATKELEREVTRNTELTRQLTDARSASAVKAASAAEPTTRPSK